MTTNISMSHRDRDDRNAGAAGLVRWSKGEHGHDFGEVAEPLFEMEMGPSPSLESVLVRGVVI